MRNERGEQDEEPPWQCAFCGDYNLARWGICRRCGTPSQAQAERNRELLKRIHEDDKAGRSDLAPE